MTRPDGERLAVVETKIDALTDKVERMESTLDAMHIEFQQRRGAERIARWFIGLGSGGFSAAIVTLLSKIGLIPMPPIK